jgi:hypothetical protein
MIMMASVTTLCCGVGLVATAQRNPVQADSREWLGGLLCIVGLLCLGVGLVVAGD